MMRLNKFLLWLLVFFLTIWEAVCFILALVNRSKALTACEEANPSSSSSSDSSSANNTTLSVGDYSATFLGMEMGNTYGLANCAQAVQADVIGSAIILFVGQLLMVSKWIENNICLYLNIDICVSYSFMPQPLWDLIQLN